jgi:GTPase
MVVLPKLDGVPAPVVTRDFVAEGKFLGFVLSGNAVTNYSSVLVLSHATTIKTRYQAMLHVGSISQTCAIIDVDRPYIRTGDKAIVAFRFIQRPEYIRPGERILFREGRTKGLGIITSVGYNPKDPMWAKNTEDSDGGNAGVALGA